MASDTVTIKKYANRRLYNTSTSSYVTLEDLAQMVKDDIEFIVRDAKTGEDITRSVLTQIIVEQETKGHHLLPTGFLRQLIGFYGDNLQGLLPQYLDMTMQSFARNQEQMRGYMEDALGGSFSSLEEIGRKNMAIFEQAMSMMTPFGARAAPASSGDSSAETLEALKSQMESMQKQLDSLFAAQKH